MSHFKKLSHVIYRCTYHIVWTPKYRFRVLEGLVKEQLLKDIPMYSMCEHHMLPFLGRAHVAYIPDKKITGLSKIVRVVDTLARRLQVQERLTTQVADVIMKKLKPKGVMVVIEAEHLCMSMRGAKKPGTHTVTSVVRGVFRTNQKTRLEALSLMSSK